MILDAASQLRDMVMEPKPTTGEWSLVPCALHFNIMCGEKVLYEGVTSESQGVILCDHHNAAVAAEREAREAQGRAYGRLKADFRKRTNKLLTVSEELQRDNQQLREQLAEAQAWIKEARHYHRDWPEDLSGRATDTTALDAAIAAARKPLVEMLIRVLHSGQLRSDLESGVAGVLAKIKKT
jgi:hypothetical protein